MLGKETNRKAGRYSPDQYIKPQSWCFYWRGIPLLDVISASIFLLVLRECGNHPYKPSNWWFPLMESHFPTPGAGHSLSHQKLRPPESLESGYPFFSVVYFSRGSPSPKKETEKGPSRRKESLCTGPILCRRLNFSNRANLS